jgi:hypothetical protein
MHVLFFFRLEERGLVLAREDDGSEDGAGEGTSKTTVLLRTSKKWMDQERYLDATQRCVFSLHVGRCMVLFLLTHFFVRVVVKWSHKDLARVDFWRSSHGRPLGII